MIANLERCLFEIADDDDFADGLKWYEVGNAYADALCDGDALKGAGIIASLSPQEGWDSNLSLAAELVDTRKAGHTSLCVGRGLEILDGGDPREVLGGQKVRSFYLNLAYPDKDGPVTIDRHAVAILFGRNLSNDERRILERPGVYERCAAVYRTVARRHGLKANQLQAITWCAWRKAKTLDLVEAF
jgi:hypothetical protein